MSRSLKYLALIIITAVTATAGYFMFREVDHVRDEVMIEAFYANREAFEQALIDRNPRLTVHVGGWNESLRLYEWGGQTELCCVSHLSWEFDTYEGYSSSKGYMYSEHQPARLLDSLDRQFPTGKYNRHIEGNWYIRLSNGFSKPE